jgi:hypothetical protein
MQPGGVTSIGPRSAARPTAFIVSEFVNEKSRCIYGSRLFSVFLAISQEIALFSREPDCSIRTGVTD